MSRTDLTASLRMYTPQFKQYLFSRETSMPVISKVSSNTGNQRKAIVQVQGD